MSEHKNNAESRELRNLYFFSCYESRRMQSA